MIWNEPSTDEPRKECKEKKGVGNARRRHRTTKWIKFLILAMSRARITVEYVWDDCIFILLIMYEKVGELT